jgi:hypothetical protein
MLRRGAEYQLLIRNESKGSLRLAITVSALARWSTASPIIDGESGWRLPRLVPGDVVEITSEGYDSQKITAQ